MTITAAPYTLEVPPEGLAEFRRAEELVRAGDAQGFEQMRALAARFPNCLTILGSLAWAVAHLGSYQEALDLYDQYLQLCPEDHSIRWRRADRLVNLGRLDEAEAEYRAVQAAVPDSTDAKMGVRYVQHLRRKKPSDSAAEAPVRRSQDANWTDLQRQNKALNEAEFAAGKLKLESLPHRLYLESTLKCNFYCKTCSKGYAPYYAEDLREGVKERVRSELMPANTRISITGFGEPTLAGDFDDILKMGLENGSLVHFVTNASLLNFERIERLTRCPVEITISFDGATKETFEAVRAGANFDLIIEKLAMIKKLRDINVTGFTSTFRFTFVALRRNIHELADVVRIAHRFDIGSVGVADYSMQATDFDEESLRYDPAAANAAIGRAKQVAAELGVAIDVPPSYEESPPPGRGAGVWEKIRRTRRLLPDRNRFPRKCSSPWTEPYVGTNGDVEPCCFGRHHDLGNISSKPFRAVWNGWRYRLLRFRIHSIMPPGPCRSCTLAWGINAANPANVMASEGLLLKAAYRCEHGIKECGSRVRGALNRIAALILRRSPAMAANYDRGRPMKKTETPEQGASIS